MEGIVSQATHGTAAALLRDWQRGFPLVPRPYRAMAEAMGCTEADVLGALQALNRAGQIARIGAVFRPGAMGASTLAAMAVPAERLVSVADRVSARPEVNHNYEREHRFNLWFVVTAETDSHVQAVLDQLAADTGLTPLALPLVTAYHIDLAGVIGGERRGGRRAQPQPPATRQSLDALDRRLLAALPQGLSFEPRPFAALATAVETTESTVIARLARWHEHGALARFGVIARHRRLGYRANAMVVWDIPDTEVDRVGRRFAGQREVTLCYRRPRRPPAWPYNLFCMIHGRAREAVTAQVQNLARQAGDTVRGYEVLFSRHCFKQRAARYTARDLPPETTAEAPVHAE